LPSAGADAVDVLLTVVVDPDRQVGDLLAALGEVDPVDLREPAAAQARSVDASLSRQRALTLGEQELRSPDGKSCAKVITEDQIRIGFSQKGGAPFLGGTEGEPIIALRFTPNSGKLIVIS
jgi:hypothetical protein